MLLWALPVLCTTVLGRAVERDRQHPLALKNGGIPGDSIVTLCPESRKSDILVIERIINRPQRPILYVFTMILPPAWM